MCDFQDNSLPTISQHEKQINNTDNPCNMPSLKIIETNMIASKGKTPKITQGSQKHEPNETHIQDKFYVMNKDMTEGEGFFEDNNMFSITNTLQSHEDNIDTDNNSRKNIGNYQLHGRYTKKDYNSNGNVHGLNTILKQMTNQGPDSKKEELFEFEKHCKQDQKGTSNHDPHERHVIECNVCKNSLGTNSTLFNHMERVHGSLQYSCDYCAYSSSSRKNLPKHLRKIHQKSMYNCNNCKFQSNSIQHISSHENTKHGRDSQVFDSIADIKVSKVKDDDNKEKQYCCRRCNATFVSENIRQKHQYRDHKLNKCSLCDKYFASKVDLRIHIMGKHTGQRPFPCPICDKAYICHTRRKKHIENSHSNKNKQENEPTRKSYPFSGCSKVFFAIYELTRHKRSHTKDKPYECSVCGEKFSLISYGVKHMKSHSKRPDDYAKSHMFLFCDKIFSKLSYLSFHQQIHTGKDRPHKCTICTTAS